MAKTSVHGAEVVTWFDLVGKQLCRLHADGTVLCRTIYDRGWGIKTRFRKNNPKGTTLAAYIEKYQRRLEAQSAPRPGLQCRCETPHYFKKQDGAIDRDACPNPVKITIDPYVDLTIDYLPSEETVRRWVHDSVVEATDGCSVEPDGTCEHGCRSWLLVLGLI